MSHTVLELQGLTKRYGSRLAVNDINLTVNEGEVYGFIGPNGAGKTTTIRIIVGLAAATAGDALVCGYSVRNQFEDAIRNVGGIIENPELYGYLTGRQNLELFAGLYKGITRQRIDEVIALVGLENRIDDKLKKYSLGMRQRAGIAQSLLHNPKILILDEPTNGLDPSGIHEMRELLKKLAHQLGVSVFISSHILSEMQQLCDRAAIIDNGRLVDVLTLSELSAAAASAVLIRTGDGTRAKEVISAAFPQSAPVEKDGTLTALLEEQEIPAAIKALVLAGIEVFGVRPVTVDLEAAYLHKTHGSRIQ